MEHAHQSPYLAQQRVRSEREALTGIDFATQAMKIHENITTHVGVIMQLALIGYPWH